MAEQIFKELKTKIALKILTFAEWNEIKDTYKPLRGEVCLCEIPAGNNQATNAPTVLFKVGDGTNVWSKLDWCSAKAADVYAWAKKTEAEFITWVNTIVEHPKAPDLTPYLVKEDITTGKTNGTIAVRGTDVAVKGLGSAAYTDANAYATTEQGTKADNAAAAIATYGDIVTHDVSEFAPANIDTGVHAVDLATGDANGQVKLTVDGESKNVNVKGLASAAYVTVDSLNATAKGYADAVEAKIPTELGVMSVAKADDTIVIGGDGKDVTIKVAENKFDAHGAAAAVEAKLADYTKTENLDTTIDGYGYLKANDVANLAEKATTLAGYGITNAYTKEEADTAFATPAEVISEVNKALADVSSADSITNITTLVEYVNENAGDLSALITEVYGAAEMTGNSRIDTAVADASEAKSNAAAAVGTANSASTVAGEAKTLAEGAVTTANEAKTAATTAQNSAAASAAAAKTSENNAKASEQAAVAAQSAAETAADDAGKAQGAAERAKAAAEAAQDAAEGARDQAQAAQSTAVTAADDAGKALASANNAKVAAEAAQGKAEAAQAAAEQAKADAVASNTSATAIANEAKQLATSANTTAGEAKTAADDAVDRVEALENANHISEITTTANGGLKVTNKNHIDIDTDIVFILNANF